MTIKPHDMGAVSRLIGRINSELPQGVTHVEDVNRVGSGVAVTLTVTLPTRSKGFTDDGGDA
jgi:hypothetical protein